MIKELFATCLLSASVGTKGLNMQTRDNPNYANYEIVLKDDNTLPTNTKTTSSDTTINAYYKTETNISGSIQAIWYQKGFEKLALNQNYYNSFAEHSYDIVMIDIQARNVNFITSYLTIDAIQYDINRNQSHYVEINTTILLTTMPNMIDQFMSIKLTDENYHDKLRDFYQSTTLSEFGYNFTNVANFYSSTNPSNNTINNSWTLQSQGIPLTQQHIYMFILTDVYGEDGENYNRYQNNTYSMLVNSIGHGLYLEGTAGIVVTPEIINIPGLMFTVLTLPFTFISQAFNLTLFPGTPYSVNISALFLAIIATLIFVWIISTILKKR